MPDKSIIENSKTDVETEKLLKFIDSVLAKNPEEQIHISFWGGEPMMNLKYCIDVMLYYKDIHNVTFFFYTNGTYIIKNLEKLVNVSNLLGDYLNQKRMEIQVSYDGGMANDAERLTKGGKSTSEEVKAGYNAAYDAGLRVSVKSTISQRQFKHIFDAFLDVIHMKGSPNYFPTPDSYVDYDQTTIEQDLLDLKDGVMKIAKYIYDNNLRADKFGWFRNSKALCNAGIDYFGVNLDGNMSACHGLMYAEAEDHVVANIEDEDVIDKLAEASLKYSGLLDHMNDDCGGCDVLFCMKCPAASYEIPSNQNTAEYKMSLKSAQLPDNLYDMKWTTKNINMCRIFKMNDTIFKPLLKGLGQTPTPTQEPSCKLK